MQSACGHLRFAEEEDNLQLVQILYFTTDNPHLNDSKCFQSVKERILYTTVITRVLISITLLLHFTVGMVLEIE